MQLQSSALPAKPGSWRSPPHRPESHNQSASEKRGDGDERDVKPPAGPPTESASQTVVVQHATNTAPPGPSCHSVAAKDGDALNKEASHRPSFEISSLNTLPGRVRSLISIGLTANLFFFYFSLSIRNLKFRTMQLLFSVRTVLLIISMIILLLRSCPLQNRLRFRVQVC